MTQLLPIFRLDKTTVRLSFRLTHPRNSPALRTAGTDIDSAVGHSAGGTVTARACQIDRRIKACISEDGEVNPVGASSTIPTMHG